MIIKNNKINKQTNNKNNKNKKANNSIIKSNLQQNRKIQNHFLTQEIMK